MATSETTIRFLLDQLSNLPGVRARKMFGEYALYCGEKVVALVCDDQLFVKITVPGKALVGERYAEGFAYPRSKGVDAGWSRRAGRSRASHHSHSRHRRRPAVSHAEEGPNAPARAGQGGTFTRFHAEAGIAAEHCFAPSFAETRWNEIAELYAMLERIDPSPLHSLNRAVAVAQGQGPHAGLAALEGVMPPGWLDVLSAASRFAHSTRVVKRLLW